MTVEKEMKQVKLRDLYRYFRKKRSNVVFRSSLTPLVLVFLFCLNSTLLHAESIEEFCLAQDIDTSKNGYMTEGQFPEKQPKPIELIAKGKTFFLKFNSRSVILIDAQNNEVSRYYFKQSDGIADRDVMGIFLGKKGWLWVDGNSDDYYAYVDTSTVPPTITAAETVAKGSGLGAGCNFFSRFLYDCERYGTKHFYSKVLERFFVFGRYPASPKMLQIVEGKPRPVPIELEQAHQTYLKRGKGFLLRYRSYDLPALGGVLFDGGPGKALFYDGEKVTSLFDSANFQKSSVWSAEMESGSEHAFLEIISDSGKIILAKIQPDLRLTQLSLPSGMEVNARFVIEQFPQFPLILFRKIFGFQQTLNIEVGNSLQTVVTLAKPLKIRSIKYFNSTLNEGIVFKTRNMKTNQFQKYFIVRASSSAQCIAKLDPDNPIVLRAAINVTEWFSFIF
jgi:hypothetical protein